MESLALYKLINKDICDLVDILNQFDEVAQATKFKDKKQEEEICQKLTSIQETIPELKIYQETQDLELSDFNIYKYFCEEFRAKRARNAKTVKFFIQEGTLIKECVDSERLSQLFTMTNCLPIMKSAFHNIFDNAYKYMPKNTELHIVCRKLKKSTEFIFSNWGPRLDEDEYEDVFNTNVRGRNCIKLPDVSGQGLGLTQVKEILELHDKWMETFCEICDQYDNDIQMINNIPYSIFSLVLGYEPISQTNHTSIQSVCFEKILNHVLHNLMQIISDTITEINKLPKISDRMFKNGNYEILYKINKIKFDLLLIQRLSYVDIDSKPLFGNDNTIKDLAFLIKTSAKFINQEEGREAIVCEGYFNRNFQCPTSFYSVFQEFLRILCQRLSPARQTMFVEIDNEMIVFSAEENNSVFLLDEITHETLKKYDEGNYKNYSLAFCCELLIDKMGIEIENKGKSIIMYL